VLAVHERKSSQNIIKQSMTAADLDEKTLATLFDNYDQSQDGVLDSKELRTLLKHIVESVVKPKIAEQKTEEAKVSSTLVMRVLFYIMQFAHRHNHHRTIPIRRKRKPRTTL
jgi:hypothetical protein